MTGIVGPEMNRPCQVVQVSDTGTPDDYGDQVLEDGTPVDTVCELQRPGGSALRSGREGDQAAIDLTLWTLFLPAGTAVTGDDYVLVDGFRYDLVSDPNPVRDPWTKLVDHIEAIVRRRT